MSAVSVSVLWVQRVLNARGADPRLVEDGVWGPATQAALARYGAPLAVDPSAGRLLLSPALEATLADGSSLSTGFSVVASVAAIVGIYFMTRLRAPRRGLRSVPKALMPPTDRAIDELRQQVSDALTTYEYDPTPENQAWLREARHTLRVALARQGGR